MIDDLTKSAISLLKDLIAIPSYSSEEEKTASRLVQWLNEFNIPYNRHVNNIWAVNENYDVIKPTILLNSHHDTVRPNSGYTRDPFDANVEEGKLFGLGSNDAGGCLVALLATFTYFYNSKNLNYNIVFVASAEEESSGRNGLGSVLSRIPKIDVAIVGEPTQMHLATAEKGLVVFDAVIKGTPSHAAHPNEDNPIYKLGEVIEWFANFKFEKTSSTLGDVKMTITQVNAGKQHNAVPAEVDFVVDVRVNDKYSNEEIAKLLGNEAPCDSITPRSLRLNSSSISSDHELVKAGVALGRKTYGSPTLSDQAVLSCPSLKLGPGDSTRSHSADEFIFLDEIREGIKIYIELLNKVL